MWYIVPPTLETLREEIETSCAATAVDTLATVARELVCRTQKCLHLQANDGLSTLKCVHKGKAIPVTGSEGP
jgi:hypothetical protein